MGVAAEALEEDHLGVVVVGGDEVETRLEGASDGEVVGLKTAVDGPAVRGGVRDVTEAAVDVAVETGLEQAAVQVVTVDGGGVQERL